MRGGTLDVGVPEDMGMPPDHLVGNGARDIVEGEVTSFLRHARMEHNLQEEIAELVLERLGLAALRGLGNFVGFLDGVGRDGGEALLEIPGTAVLGIAQPRHDVEQARQIRGGGHAVRCPSWLISRH